MSDLDPTTHYFDDDKNNDIITELLADIPMHADQLVHRLEEDRISPSQSLDKYTFSSKDIIFYSYPKIITEYRDLYHLSPTSISISLSKYKHMLPEVSIIIAFSDGSAAEILSEDKVDIDSAYSIKFLHTADIPKKYHCSPEEAGHLLASMAISPENAHDLTDEARQGTTTAINPRDKYIYAILIGALEKYATDFSQTRDFLIDLSDSQRDDTKISKLRLVTTRYCNGSTGHEITLHHQDISSDVLGRASISGSFEIVSEGGLNVASVEGHKDSLLAYDSSQGKIPANISYAALCGALERAYIQPIPPLE